MFERLQQQFENNTRERFKAMRSALDALEIDSLFRHFHGLAGLGATYKRPELSRLATTGERETLPYRKSGTPAAEETQRWRELIDAMEALLDGPRPDEGPRLLVAVRSVQPQFELLLVVAEADLREQLEQVFAAEGYAVRTTEALESARQELRVRIPNAVVSSIALADGTGYELVRELRELPGAEPVLIALIGTPQDAIDRVEAIRCGADVCFDALDLKALLRRMGIACQAQCGPSARILIVEDEPEQVRILSSILESAGYETRACGTAAEVEPAISSFEPDLVLLDVNLPGGASGHEVARVLRQDDRNATIPVVMVTTETGLESMLGTIKAGGDDHLVKPIQPGLLLTVVNSRLQRARLLRALVDRDGLTGLLTHSVFQQQVERAAGTQRREDDACTALVIIDVDHFKSVNDRYGHRTGDRVLTSLGAFLRRRVRQSDAIARYGGEEFSLLLRNLPESDAVRLVEELLGEFAAIEHRAPAGTFRVTFGAGVAMLATVPSGRAGDWIEAADRALYEAKRTGRARVVSAGNISTRSAA